MPSWFSVLIDIWPIASTLTPLILLGGFYWLQTKFPSKAEFGELAAKVEGIETTQTQQGVTLKALSADREAQPTRIELLREIGSLEGRVSGVEAGVRSINDQLKTANDYLQILVERGLGR